MARREISGAEERRLIAASERARDAGEVGERANVKVSADATAVLSVRLPMEQLRAIRENAASQGISISSLLQQALALLAAKPKPRMTATQQVTRLWVEGVVPEMESMAAPNEAEPNSVQTETGGYMLAGAR